MSFNVRLATVLTAALLSSLSQAQSTFRGLGFLPPGYHQQVLGMSRNGAYVVGAIQNPNMASTTGFSWSSNSGFSTTDLGAAAYDAADNGYIVGQLVLDGTTNGNSYIHKPGTQNTRLSLYFATAISNDGNVVAGPTTNPSQVNSGGQSNHVQLMTNTGSFGPALPYVNDTFGPFGIRLSSDGSVVTGSYGGAQNIGFRWTAAAGMQLITDRDCTGINVLGQSADGNILVGWADTPNGPEAMRWRASDGVQLITGNAPYGGSESTGVSADGNVVVGRMWNTSGNGFSESRAFIWTPRDGVQLLEQYLPQTGVTNLISWHLDNAVAVSNDGTKIAGYGRDPFGNLQGFYVTIKPPKFVDEPGVAALTAQPNPRVGGNSLSCRVDLGYAPTTKTSRVFIYSPSPTIFGTPSAALNNGPGVLIPVGSTTGYCPLQTHGVAVPTKVNLEAIPLPGSIRRRSSVTLLPADLHLLKLSPSSVKGGASSQLTIPLNGEAPVAGGTVKLKSSDPAVRVPATADFGSYARAKTVTVSTSAVTSVKQVTISATYRGHVQSTILTVNP